MGGMSARGPFPTLTGEPLEDNDIMTPFGVPLDDAGNSLIPELQNRAPTHNESVMLGGHTVKLGSTNVDEVWYFWQERRLFVRFRDGSLYAYDNVPLSIAVGMVEAGSAGRYVWNVLRVGPFPYRRMVHGNIKNPKPGVVRRVEP
jgi:hypothetical protein